ncbi:MAG: hypothetical protein GEV03_20555 [Streptosporangiales bacterium]|nr:hypothetical protein [Streptosporangiales bacterium]
MVLGPPEERPHHLPQALARLLRVGVDAQPVHVLPARVVRRRPAGGETLRQRAPHPGDVRGTLLGEDGLDVLPGGDVVGRRVHLAPQVRPIHLPPPLQIDPPARGAQRAGPVPDHRVVPPGRDVPGVGARPGQQELVAPPEKGQVVLGRKRVVPPVVRVHDVELAPQQGLVLPDRPQPALRGECAGLDPGTQVGTPVRRFGSLAWPRRRAVRGSPSAAALRREHADDRGRHTGGERDRDEHGRHEHHATTHDSSNSATSIDRSALSGFRTLFGYFCRQRWRSDANTRNRAFPGRTMLLYGHKLVFVGGLHRSGTTPLARCLAAHPDVSGFRGTDVREDEGQHLQSVYRPAHDHGGPGRFARSAAAHLTERSPLATEENAERLFAQWRPYWELDAPVLVEKSPPNLLMSRFLQALFPEAYFVVVVRHPVVVTLSTKKWAPRVPLESLLAHWFRAHDTFSADAPHLRRLHVLKYETLVSEPEKVLLDLARFLDLDGPIPAGGIRNDRSARYQRVWDGFAASRLAWRRWRQERMCTRYEKRANRYGYSLRDLRHLGPFPIPFT